MNDAEELKERYETFATSLDYNTTASDYQLRELEIDTAAGYMRAGQRTLDVGCALGYAVVQYASRTNVEAHGIDYAENMIAGAQELLSKNRPNLQGTVSFRQASVMALPYPAEHFDVVSSSRCLMALLDWDLQKQALAEIHRVLKPGGVLVLMEGTFEGLDRLNSARERFGLAAIAVTLGVIHLWLMPRVPLFDLLSGDTDFYRLSIDRENAAKLLAVPAIVKYAFTWDSAILLPILFVAAILYRWRYLAIFIGAFGLIYVTAPLDKFPSLIFVFSAFVALAVRDRKRAFSKVLLIGFLVSLIPAYLITESSQISVALHHAVGAPVMQSTAPPDATNSPPPGEVPVTHLGPIKLPGPIANLLDLTVRRIGSGPADVTYQWFSYFPAVHPFLNGYGWEPWRVLSSGYQSPANMVGLWAYYGKFGYRLTSISAYTGFLADGWAEFGYIGVLIACLWLFAFAVVIELMRAFNDKPFCLACYVPCLLMVAATAPISGIMAMTFSLGISFGPLICLGYLLSSRIRRRTGRAHVADLQRIPG